MSTKSFRTYKGWLYKRKRGLDSTIRVTHVNESAKEVQTKVVDDGSLWGEYPIVSTHTFEQLEKEFDRVYQEDFNKTLIDYLTGALQEDSGQTVEILNGGTKIAVYDTDDNLRVVLRVASEERPKECPCNNWVIHNDKGCVWNESNIPF